MDYKRPVFFFDIDNCLYSRKSKVYDAMFELIDSYIMDQQSVTREAAHKIHDQYLKDHGLAVEGLVKELGIDPLDFNRQVDDALPLEELLTQDSELRAILEDFDRTKVKLWLFTNAYVNHAKKVVQILGIEDQFEGMTFCDYRQSPIRCKPHEDAFFKAMREADVQDVKSCYFVDDSAANCMRAESVGWTATHLLEEDVPPPAGPVCSHEVRHVRDLKQLYPDFFKAH